MPWTVHDLRRTVATGLARLGCPRVVQDRILNHVDNSVAAIYDRHSYDTEKRNALERWGEKIGQIINPKELTDNIINLGQATKPKLACL